MSEGAEWNDKIVEMARAFHDEYEVQAKRFGWQSRTPVSFDELPEANKQTMLNVIAQVVPWNVVADLADLRAQLAQRDEELTALREKVRGVYELVTLFDYTAVYDLKSDILAALSDDQDKGDRT